MRQANGAPGLGAPDIASDQSVHVVLVRVLLCSVFGVFDCVQLVTMGKVRMMAGLVVIACLGMFGCCAVVPGGLVEVLGGFMMVVMNFVLVAHGKLLHQW
jgi:hypothetical protein